MIHCYGHFAAEPYYNMAFDEWMFGKALTNAGAVYLRLYTWDQPAITFGYNQAFERAVDHSHLGDTTAIRRVTGGRALLHDPSELTYSIAINMDKASGANPVQQAAALSAAIAGALVDFLTTINIECEIVRASSPRNSHPDFFHKAPCFASAARYEIMREGRKIVASAQRRLEGTVFQHGSIKIGGVASHPAVNLDDKGGESLENLRPINEKTFQYMQQQFMAAFERRMGPATVTRELSQSDRESFSDRLNLVRKNCLLRRDIFKQK